MRVIFTIIFIIASAKAVKCQTFFAEPANLVAFEVQPGLANECFVFFDNPGGDTLQLRWRALETSFPTGWDIDLCDYGLCYVGIPATGLMNPIYDTIQAYLRLIVQPGSTPGDGWLWFRVHENGNNNNYQDVFFSLYTPGITAQTEPETGALAYGPNPADSRCTIHNNKSAGLPVRLIDLNGKIRFDAEIPGLSALEIPLNGLPSGMYLLQTGNQTQKLIVKH